MVSEHETLVSDEGVEVKYYKQFMEAGDDLPADVDGKDIDGSLYRLLLKDVDWQQETVKVFNKDCTPKRKTASYGNKDNLVYKYSGTTKQAVPWSSAMNYIKACVEQTTGNTYNFALLNLYEDGNSSIGAHSDDEKTLVKGSDIASVSLGQERTFVLHHKTDKKKKHTVDLESGSLLVMGGACQKVYKHSVPVRKKVKNGRINITFRNVKK